MGPRGYIIFIAVIVGVPVIGGLFVERDAHVDVDAHVEPLPDRTLERAPGPVAYPGRDDAAEHTEPSEAGVSHPSLVFGHTSRAR